MSGFGKRRFGGTLWLILPIMLTPLVAVAQEESPEPETAAQTNLLSNPGFEILKPSLWEPSGAGAEWTNRTSRTPDWSLSLSGSGRVEWKQNEAVQEWISGFPEVGNPRFEVGGWVKLEGVNTGPVSEDEKFQLVFEFFADPHRTSDAGEGPIILDLPQDQPSTNGWVEIVSEPISLRGPQAGKSVAITFVKGSRTSGVAFLDDVFVRMLDSASTGWVGNFCNPNMDVGYNWIYWWEDFYLGLEGWPADQPHYVTVSDEDSHSGSYSLRMEATGPNPFEAAGVSKRFPIVEGEALLVSFWVKYVEKAGTKPVGADLNNLGLTVLWFDRLVGGSSGFGLIQGIDILLDGSLDERLIPVLGNPGEWMHYAIVVYPPEGAVAAHIRPRYWHEFQGVTYWDDFFVASVSDVTRP
jgi:hypothetical protein